MIEISILYGIVVGGGREGVIEMIVMVVHTNEVLMLENYLGQYSDNSTWELTVTQVCQEGNWYVNSCKDSNFQ